MWHVIFKLLPGLETLFLGRLDEILLVLRAH